MFDNYPEGYDLTILNAEYIYPRRDDNGKYTKGFMNLLARDNTNGEIIKETIEDPLYTYYMIKDEAIQQLHIDYIVKEIEKKYCEPVTVPYRDLLKDIASRIGELDFYFDNIKNKNRAANKMINIINPKILFSDMNIEDYYRFRFAKKYTNRADVPITKGFIDIEVDTINMKGDFPELGECPVNAITYIDLGSMQSFTLLLRDNTNPLCAKFEQDLKDKKILPELRDLIIDHIGGAHRLKEFNIEKLKFNFIFFDEEIKLIAGAFSIIHQLKPNFVMAWNMAFDIPYLYQRLMALGYDPSDIMCHQDFKHKTCKYYIDKGTEVFGDRKDYYKITGYTSYFDQMIQYAGIRKGRKIDSFTLDDTTNRECHFGKLDYHHITPYLSELPYKDYKIFVFYNICDVINQVCIEAKTGDVDFIFTKALVNNTRYEKVNRQTVYLINRMVSEYWDMGLICGNNKNIFNPDSGEKYSGAFVADPMNVGSYSKLKIGGVPITIYDNLDDYDYKRLYPTMMQQFNISDPTQIGRIIFPNDLPEHQYENLANSEKLYNREGAFIDDLASKNYIQTCNRWFGLATFNEMLDDVEEFFTLKQQSMSQVPFFNQDGTMKIYRKINSDLSRSLYRKIDPNIQTNISIPDNSKKKVLIDAYNKDLGFKA